MTETLTTSAESCGTLALRDVPLGSPTRPSWRGRLHLIALVVAVPLGALVSVDADGGRIRVGVIIYAVGLCSMFGVSTTYHRWVHTIRARSIWRRADHATIFVAIAATSTPLCLTFQPTSAAAWRLAAVWCLAAIGIVAKATGTRPGNHLGNVLYIVNSWAGMFILRALWSGGYVTETVLIITGGLIYTIGALGFARRWPTLKPTVFSYHEVWHLCTLTAAGAHLAAVWIVVA